MSTSLVSSLLLYRHRKVPAVFISPVVEGWQSNYPLGVVTVKNAPLRIHHDSKRLINRIGFPAGFMGE